MPFSWRMAGTIREVRRPALRIQTRDPMVQFFGWVDKNADTSLKLQAVIQKESNTNCDFGQTARRDVGTGTESLGCAGLGRISLWQIVDSAAVGSSTDKQKVIDSRRSSI